MACSTERVTPRSKFVDLNEACPFTFGYNPEFKICSTIQTILSRNSGEINKLPNNQSFRSPYETHAAEISQRMKKLKMAINKYQPKDNLPKITQKPIVNKEILTSPYYTQGMLDRQSCQRNFAKKFNILRERSEAIMRPSRKSRELLTPPIKELKRLDIVKSVSQVRRKVGEGETKETKTFNEPTFPKDSKSRNNSPRIELPIISNEKYFKLLGKRGKRYQFENARFTDDQSMFDSFSCNIKENLGGKLSTNEYDQNNLKEKCVRILNLHLPTIDEPSLILSKDIKRWKIHFLSRFDMFLAINC